MEKKLTPKESLIRAKRQALRRFMKKNGLKVSPWCEKAGISEGALRAYIVEERTDSMKQSNLDALALAAGTTVEKMFSDDDERAAQVSKLDDCRTQLDAAIKLWFEDYNSTSTNAAIHTLALTAYKIIFADEVRAGTEKEPAEGLIIATIMEMQLQNERLTKPEIAFILWFSAHDPVLSKNKAGILGAQIVDAKGGNKTGKFDKLAFYKTFTGEGHI